MDDYEFENELESYLSQSNIKIENLKNQITRYDEIEKEIKESYGSDIKLLTEKIQNYEEINSTVELLKLGKSIYHLFNSCSNNSTDQNFETLVSEIKFFRENVYFNSHRLIRSLKCQAVLPIMKRKFILKN